MESLYQEISILKVTHQDQKYIDGVVNSDDRVIEEIYKRFSQPVVSLISKYGGDESIAKDIFQDVLLSIWRQGKNGLTLRCNFQSFFLNACKKRFYTHLQSKYCAKTMNGETMIQDTIEICPSVDDIENENIKYNLIKEKMKMLGPSCKEIIEISLTQDENGKYLSWIEIAQQLEISYAYVRKKAVECKQRLIDLIQKDPTYNQLKK